MIHGGQVVQRIGIAGVHRQRLLVILPSLIERKHVVISNTDFVPDHRGPLIIALVSVDRGSVASMNHEQIAFDLGTECGGRGWGGHIGGRGRRV